MDIVNRDSADSKGTVQSRSITSELYEDAVTLCNGLVLVMHMLDKNYGCNAHPSLNEYIGFLSGVTRSLGGQLGVRAGWGGVERGGAVDLL